MDQETGRRIVQRVELGVERFLFASRWILAPFYLGLALAIIILLIKFIEEFAHIAFTAFTASEADIILGVLSLVDLTLTASLLVIVMFSGYENFVSISGDSHGPSPAASKTNHEPAKPGKPEALTS